MNALAEVLYEHRDDAPTFGGGLSNHLPMAVTALAQMGAPDERLRSFARGYAATRGLVAMDAAERATRDRWAERLRDGATAAGLLPAFAASIGAAAFHGIIRTNYALEAGVRCELAAALAAWEAAAAAEVVTESPYGVDGLEAVDAAEALRRLAALAKAVAPGEARGLISARVRRVAAEPAFALVAAIVPGGDALDELVLAAAAAFARSGDFTALHVMTGTHAMRRLLPSFGEAQSAALAAYWRAYAAAAIVSGAPPSLHPVELATLRAEAPADWNRLLEEAIAHDDDHAIKSVATARALDAELHDGVFRCAAARYLERRRATGSVSF